MLRLPIKAPACLPRAAVKYHYQATHLTNTLIGFRVAGSHENAIARRKAYACRAA